MTTINTQFHFEAKKPNIGKDMAHIKSTKFFGGQKTVVDQLKEAQKSGKSTIVIDALIGSDKAYEAAFKGEFKGVFNKVIFYSKSATLTNLRNRLTPSPKKSTNFAKIAILALGAFALGATAYITGKNPAAHPAESMKSIELVQNTLGSTCPRLEDIPYDTCPIPKLFS